MQKAAEIMTKDVITVTPETTVIELAQLLASKNIGGVPVLDASGTLLGVVTVNDLIDQKKKLHIPTVITILDSVFYLENPDKMEKEMKKIAGATVGDIYSKNPRTVVEETLIDEIATLMSEKDVHTLPVMRGDTLVGVIGKRDIIKTLIP
ncbi:CBS domain-containing protein [Desulfopila sp. IMCC35006]|uniref:CBS domain-containing protein n=1 Tax=Desulfopila sp. IMCC35006 TaxID=2569542 RepID=UPI0010AD74D5|nr:CBS domain-containing protein [Desulfopila sp. IMCC35006]TKB27037.1 CBS domain-containing protein [Desulfopila sp. IMCC35006]